MGKLIDLTGLSEFKTKLLNLINTQLADTVKTVNGKSATNHAVDIYASDVKMSSSDSTTIPNKLKQYVKSVNSKTPNQSTGNIVTTIKKTISIPVASWGGSGPYTYTFSDTAIVSGMEVLSDLLSDEYAQLGVNSYTIQAGKLIISTTVKPTSSWTLTVILGTCS